MNRDRSDKHFIYLTVYFFLQRYYKLWIILFGAPPSGLNWYVIMTIRL